MPVITAPDGTSLVFDAYEPPEPRGALLFFPGWFDHAGRWTRLGNRLRESGLSTYCLDPRGHGRSGGRRGHLSRFSQLLGDLQAFRRAVRLRTARPQVLLGHGFGGLVVLRYLETQPADAPVAAILSNPWLALAFDRPRSHVFLRRLLADVWPTARLRATVESTHLSRDAAVNAAYDADPKVHRVVTPGAWKEIQWAQRAVAAERARIESPLMFLLAGEDRLVDAHHTRAFADGLQTRVHVQWYPEMYHEILQDPRAEDAVNDMLRFLAAQGL